MHAALDDKIRVGGSHYGGAIWMLWHFRGEKLNVEIAISNHICKRLLNSECVKLWVEVPVGEIVEADRPRWITGIIAHQIWDVDFAWLWQDLCRNFVLFSIRLLCQLLIIIRDAAKGEELVYEVFASASLFLIWQPFDLSHSSFTVIEKRIHIATE